MPAQQNSSNSWEELVTAIVSHEGLEAITKQLLPQLRHATHQVLIQLTESSDPLLILDPHQHTAGYAYFLVARCQVERPDVALLLPLVLQFLEKYDPNQARIIPEKMGQVGQCLSKLATVHGNNIVAIRPLARAIQKYAPTPHHLTNLHQIFVKECLLAKCYKQALPILDIDILEIDVQQTGIQYTDHLLYHYYGGMIYIGLKKFERALNFLKLVISAPANAASAIQVEAYKKFVLVSLLVHGKIDSLPKYTAQPVIRAFKTSCQVYQEYASAFESTQVKRTRAEFSKAMDTFKKDKNLGLAKQTLDALWRRRILNLTQTYLTLSLAEVANLVNLEGANTAKIAEDYVLRMIETGEIYASIDHSHQNGMVSFHDSPDHYDTTQTITHLEQQIAKASEVNERIIKSDRVIGCSKDYLAKAQHMAAGGGFSGNMGATDENDFFTTLIEDPAMGHYV